MSKVKVTIAAEDITQGTRYNVRTCPTALALKRAFPKAFRTYVGIDAAFVEETENAEQTHRYDLPSEAMQFVYLFDAKRSVSPFSFELEIEEATS